MNILFVGYATTWDALVAALGYLNYPVDDNPYYGKVNIEPGQAILVGYDEQNQQVYALGAASPSLVKKIIQELIKVGNPQSQQVEVIALCWPGSKKLRSFLNLGRWPLVGKLVQQYTYSWAKRKIGDWWEQGQSIKAKKSQE